MSLLESYKFFKWDTTRKRFYPEWWRRAIVPTWLTFASTDQQLPLVVNGYGTMTKPVHFKQDYGSAQGADNGFGQPFLGKHLVFTDSTSTVNSKVAVRLRNAGMARDYMNRPIPLVNLAGTAQLPFRLREPIFFPSDQNILAEFSSYIAGAPSTTKLRLYMHGATYYAYDPILQQYPEEKARMYDLLKKWQNRMRYIHPYWLTTDQSDVTVTDQGTGTFYSKCGDDGCVEIFGLTAVSNKAEFQVEISEVETRTTLHNGAITQTNGVGTGSLPFRFPTSYLLPPGARVKLKFTDIGTAGSDLTVSFCMFGRKIYAPMKDAKDAMRDLVVPTAADERFPAYPPGAF